MKRLLIALSAVLCCVFIWQYQHREIPNVPASTRVDTAESIPTSTLASQNTPAGTAPDLEQAVRLETAELPSDSNPTPVQDTPQNEPPETEAIAGSLEAWPFQAAKTLQSRDTPISGTDMFERVRTVHTQFKYPFLRVVERWVQDPGGDARLTQRVTMVANHILVKLQPDATEADLTKLNNDYGARILKKMVAPGMYLVALPSLDIDSVPDAVSTYNKATEKIAYSEPDMIVFAAETFPDDPSLSQLYGLHNTGQSSGTDDADIDAPEAWDLVTGGQVVIGVIDTGVEYTHTDLAANMWVNPGEIAGDGNDNDGNGFIDDVHGWDFLNDDSDPIDDNSHGTHCSGTIAGAGNNGTGVVGVNWSAKIMALKFLSSGGSGPISDAVNCQAYANMMRTNGVNIRLTSNSWGGGGFSQSMADVIATAQSLDMLFIAAAGNSANDNDVSPYYPATYTNDNVIAVAATDRNDNKASFSSYGLTTVDLGAPGVSTYSTVLNNGYGIKSGTSMATPHVAGVAALIWNFSPSETSQNVKDVLLLGTDPVAAMAGITVSGGRLNAFNSIVSLGMRIRSTTPAASEVVTAPPNDVIIEFTDDYNPSSVQAGDLTVNAIPADTFTLTTPNTVTYHFNNTPVTTEGLQTVQMSNGAVARLSDGDVNGDYMATFRYDTLPMQVLSTLPQDGSTVTVPMTSLRLNLNEACDPASATIDDLLLSQGQVTDVNLLNNNTIVEFILAGIVDEGTLSITLPEGALTDVFGNPALAHSGLFHVDSDVAAYPTPFVRIEPAGSLIYDPSATAMAFITPAGDTDSYTFNLDSGQTVSVLVDPDAALQPTIELYDPSNALLGSHTAAAAGAPGVLQTVFAANPGTYTVTVGGGGNSAGSYSVQVFLNVALEDEQHGGAVNDALVSAQTVDGSFIGASLPGMERAAVLGSIGSSSSSPIFSENFESASLSGAWSTYSSDALGRIRVTGAHGTAGGSQALIMDRTSPGAYTLNEAIYTVDLSGLNDATLSFSHAFWNDEQQTFGGAFVDHANSDGIAISDNGVTWSPLWSAAGTQPFAAWVNYEFDLEAAAAAAGMQLNAQFQIKFQQYDDYPLTSDGRGWDEIAINSSNPTEDWYSFTLNSNDQISLVLADLNDGTLELELHDAGGLLAVGASGAANVDKSIAGASIPQTGTYYARVAGSGQEAYSLVITRNARFDVEPNDTSAEAIDISAAGASCGALTCSPLLFALDWRYPPPSVILQLDPVTMDIVNQFQAPIAPHEHQSKHNLAFDGQHLWYNGGSNPSGDVTIYKLDASDGTVVDSFAASMPVPLGLAWMNGELFATDSTKTIHVFDDTTYTLKRTITPNTILAVAAFDADAKRNQLLGVTAQTLYRIDPANGNILSSSPAPREGQERGLGVVCDEIFISEFGGRIAAFDAETGAFLRRMDGPYTQFVGGLAGHNTGAPEDWYRIQANAGASLTLSTGTPSGDPQQSMEFLNTLDPAVELYDPNMVLVGSDDNSAADGKNALLNANASLSGTYYVRVVGAFGSKGEYVLSATGGGGTSPNNPPTVDAGANASITRPADATLDGTITDDGLPIPPGVTTTLWTKVSGPGTVSFGDSSAEDSSASFSIDGSYTLRLSAYDGEFSASDDLIITVTSLPNQPPVAAATGNPTSGEAPLTVSFDGSGSSDADGTIQSYSWTFGDGASDSAPQPSHTYGAGSYTATLTVTDDDGATGSNSVSITVTEPPNQPPVAAASGNPTSGEAPLTVSFDGSGSGDTDGTIVSYAWDFGDGTSSASASPGSHTYSAGSYTATLTVTDDDGATGSNSVSITVTEPPHQITASAGSNGSVDPNGAVSVAHGSSQTFTITPDPDYQILDVQVDGSSVGAMASYTFNNVVADHRLAASFESIYPVGDTAISETSVEGTVLGSLTNSYINDDVYEAITEEVDGSPTSRLEHQWTFDVYGAELVTFYVEAHHDANTEGDDMVFAYSTDQVNWVDMLTVIKTADDDTAQFYPLPSGLSGTVYVRALDADRSPGHTALDTLYVDALFIASDLPSIAPNPATAPNPPHAATDVPLAPTLSWSGGAQASSHDVYFGDNPVPDTAEFQGNQLGTTFTPGTLSPSTTYYWAIDEVNSTGITAGATWSFLTETPPPEWVELVYEDFENDWGNWTDGGRDAKLSSTYAIGSRCLNLQDNSSSSYSQLAQSLNLTAYTAIKIEFTYAAKSFEGGENFWVLFSNDGGSTWTTMQVFVNDADFIDNGTRYNPEILVNNEGSFTFTSSVKIRIQCDASDGKDDVFIDNIRISGLYNPAPPEAASSPSPADGAANVSTEAQLDWTAGQGANSHDVYFGTSPSPEFAGNQPETGFDPGVLAINTTYYWMVNEVNTYGTAVGSVWSFTTAANTPTWTELVYDDFESGWGNWAGGGSDAMLSSTYAIDSTCLNLQDNSRSSESELTGSLNLTGYTELKIEFSYVVASFERSEDFWVRFSSNGGSSWTTIKAFVNDVDFIDNGTRYNPELILDSGNYPFTSNVKILFECDASKDTDDVYIDNIRISAK